MTEIDELTGVELTRAVVAAQGWTVDDDGIYVDAEGVLTQYDGCERENSPDVYRPDRDIAQAWELVEELDGLGWYLCLARYAATASGDERRWECAFERHTEERADGDTPTEAICRAYLKAKEAIT